MADGGDGEGVGAPGRTAEREHARVSRALPLIAGTFCAQTALLAMFLGGRIDAAVFAALHLAVCVAVAGLGRLGRRDEAAIALQLAAWTALGGVFGSVMASALLVPHGPEATGVGGSEADGGEARADRAGLTRLELIHGALLDGRLRISGADAARPLLDVILDGVQTEKFDALSIISKNYEPALALALRRALEDRDGTVRVLAATVFAQLNNSHTKRIGALQTAAAAAPTDAAGWRDLGRAQLAYAESRLLDASRAEAEAARAAEHLTRAAELGPADADIRDLLKAALRLSDLARPRATAIRIPDHANEDMVPANAA